MATIKSYTDIKQSRKLAEILPIESADMAYYQWKDDGHLMSPVPFVLDGMEEEEDGMFDYILCWSLASLLGVIKNVACYQMLNVFDNRVFVVCDIENKPYHVETEVYYNEVDACVELILKLHELNLL